MKKSYYHKIVLIAAGSLLLVYLASWIIMPHMGKSFELSFDNSCYTGGFTLFDRQGSSCSDGQFYPVGFPFVLRPGAMLENLLSILVNLVPVAVLVAAMAWAGRGNKTVRNHL